MQHLQPGELVALEHEGQDYLFLVLSKSAFFGCQWTFAMYETRSEVPEPGEIDPSAEEGFVALIDFIEPRRSNSVIRITKGIEVDEWMSFTRTKALIRDNNGGALWYIYDKHSQILEKKPMISNEELDYPIASGMQVSQAFGLIDARWSPRVLVSASDDGQFPFDRQK